MVPILFTGAFILFVVHDYYLHRGSARNLKAQSVAPAGRGGVPALSNENSR